MNLKLDDDVLGCRAGQVVDLDERREVVNCHKVLPSIQFKEISPNFHPWALAIAVLSQRFFLFVGLHPLACPTVFCCLLYVLSHTWPVQQLSCSSQHGVIDKIGRVPSLLHFTSQSERNQDSLPLQEDSILMIQRVTDVKVQTDGFWDVTLPGWPSFVNELKECLYNRIFLRCFTDLLCCLVWDVSQSSSPSHKHQSQDQEEKHDSECLQ